MYVSFPVVDEEFDFMEGNVLLWETCVGTRVSYQTP